MERVLTGKWRWNDVIKPMPPEDDGIDHDIYFRNEFESNGQKFKNIRFYYDDFWRLTYYSTSAGTVEAGAGHYEDDYATPSESYRIIDFGNGCRMYDDADGEFVDWLLSNITRYGTFAEKLEQAAENEKAVYQSGYDKALSLGSYNKGFEAGKQAEHGAFWDAIQNYGNRIDYQAAFAQWDMDYIRPKHKVVPTSTNLGSMFNNNKALLAVEKAYFDFSKITSLTADYMCNACDKLLIFEDCGVPALNSYSRSWRGCGKLHTIEVVRSKESTTFAIAFENCKSLINITFDGVIGQDIDLRWSTQLTRASIESIVNHLSDNSGGNTAKVLTLSNTAVDEAFRGISPSDFTTIVPGSSSLDWFNLDSDARMKNWTITLV